MVMIPPLPLFIKEGVEFSQFSKKKRGSNFCKIDGVNFKKGGITYFHTI